jgi:peptidoglycan/xylan/chitin deacetylase (PgdA/CDA1 family)
VLLLHDGGGDRTQTVDAVERLLPRLRADGWTFTLPAPA